MINEEAISAWLLRRYPGVEEIRIRILGSGVQGSGFLIEMKEAAETRSYVVKRLLSEGLGHDYPSDRAAVFLLDLDEYANLPNHVRAVDVLAEMGDGTIKSIGGGREYYLLMERGEGRDYFHDLRELRGKNSLDGRDTKKIAAMASYLAKIHSVKKDSRTLYWRKLRDTVGHGECLMGVFDTYPDGTLSYADMAGIEKQCVDWRARLKPLHERLCQIHGDFHPGNIWFRDDGDFILLDRSRGPWGEPADDVTALAINYIFFSVRYSGDVRGAYYEALRFLFGEYVRLAGDKEIYVVVAPFFAFRAAVVANPVFYPDLSNDARAKIFRFTKAVLSAESFEPERVNDYLR
ncbi:MAG: phosphotransferase [Nitrospiraceae bacterium]|nr:phosphotransferase [Nitrospiraceae bacterium]